MYQCTWFGTLVHDYDTIHYGDGVIARSICIETNHKFSLKLSEPQFFCNIEAKKG